MVEALTDVEVEDHFHRVLGQMFPAGPHYLLEPSCSVQILPQYLIQLTTRWGSVYSSAPLFTRVSSINGHRSDDTTTKSVVDCQPRVSPSAVMDTLMAEHGVSYGQDMISTEI